MAPDWFVPDPFPSIPCALLHSGDLRLYAEHGSADGQLFQPFDKANLKSASYEVSFHGTAYWWEAGLDHSEPKRKQLGAGDTLEIPRNGIVFVQPAVKFKVPPFLALRFNLHISLVHRGLLLGTGPLVDPGFEGRLLIPVHNLTDKRHVVSADDGFIWIEVTKLSFPSADDSRYVPFPSEKKNLDACQYFQKASHGEPIRSSIPSIAEDVEKAKVSLAAHERRANWMLGVTVITVIVGLAALTWSSWAIWRDTYEFVGTVKSERGSQITREVQDQTAELRRRVDSLERELLVTRREQDKKRVGTAAR